MLPNLLKQIRRKTNEISADSAYDTRQRYTRTTKKEIIFWKRDHLRNLAISYQKLYGSN